METQGKAVHTGALLPVPTVLAKDLAARYSLDPGQYVETLKKTYFGGTLTDPEISAALAICKRYDLDPFLREIHCTKNGDRLMIMVGIDGWLRAAHRAGLCGIDAPEVEVNDKEQATAVTVTVHKKDWPQPVRWTAYMAEWRKKSPTWDSQPVHMLTLKAMKLALRFGFGIGGGLDLEDPDELGGAPANGKAPGVRSSAPLPAAVIPRPVAAKVAAGGTAPAAQAAPAGGGGFRHPTHAAVTAERAPQEGTLSVARPGEDEVPWDADDLDEREAGLAAPVATGAAPAGSDAAEAVTPAKTAPAAGQATQKPGGLEAVIEAVRDLESKLTAAGETVHVSSREELEEQSRDALQSRATELRQKLWTLKKPGRSK